MHKLYFDDLKYERVKPELEKHFLSGFLRACKDKGYWTYKITDISMGIKPFDFLLETDDESYKGEAKVIENNIFGLRMLRDNQISAFVRLEKLGKICLVVVFSKKQQDYILIDFSNLLIDGIYNVEKKILIDFENKKFKWL